MTLKLRDVRIAQLAVEASLDAIDEVATGPLATIGTMSGYRDLFAGALTSANGLDLPWPAESPDANKFWANYVTGMLPADDPEAAGLVAWQWLVPLKPPAGIVAGTLAGARRAFAEAFVWPTGIGFSRNYWIEGAIEPAEIGRIVGEAGDLQRRHETFDAVRNEMWGVGKAGVRSDVMTIVSVVRTEAGSAEEEAAALAAILDGLALDERPRILPADEAANRLTVHCADDFRLVWHPSKARSTRRTHSLGCFHRNLTMAALQARLIGGTILALDNKRAGGALHSSYDSLVGRLGKCRDRFWTPHLTAWLGGAKVANASAAIGL
ncbi:MAG TPA: hypothetical protein VJS15_10375 [Allosphingosinicella sp.]|nr:hypothetical protein [Allosphingosinicella sp.]